MRALLLILPFLLVAGTVYVVLAASHRRAVRGLQTALRERDELVQHLRELAWDHRDVSPELATIVLDEIRQAERRGMGREIR